jgi:hypothetical protein
MPAEILAIEGKAARSEEEKKQLEAHYTSDVKLLANVPIEGGVFAIAYRPDGKSVAVAGEDGKVRFVTTTEPKIAQEFVPVPITAAAPKTAQAETK